MSFFDFFKNKKTPQEPEPPKTREDLENTLSVRYLNYIQVNTEQGVLQRAFQNNRPPQEEEKKLLSDVFDLISSVPEGKNWLTTCRPWDLRCVLTLFAATWTAVCSANKNILCFARASTAAWPLWPRQLFTK